MLRAFTIGLTVIFYFSRLCPVELIIFCTFASLKVSAMIVYDSPLSPTKVLGT